jgi:hypothetical protein
MCTVLLPPGDNPIAGNKNIIKYYILHLRIRCFPQNLFSNTLFFHCGFFSLLHRACCFDYFFNIPTHPPIIYTLRSTKFTLKHLETFKICPYMFRSIFRPSSWELVDSILCSYQVEIGWCTLVILLCSMRPYVITVRLCMYMEYLTGWNSMTRFHPVRYSRYIHKRTVWHTATYCTNL